MLKIKPRSAPGPDGQRGRVLSQAVVETAGRLQLRSTDLTAIIGVSQPTASRLMNGKYQLAEGGKSWELGAHLVRLYRSLYSMVGGSDDLARAWLRSDNQAFAGQAPLQAIRTVEGLVHACDYVDAHRARV